MLLHLGKGGGQSTHHSLVGNLVHVALYHEPKIEDELISVVLCVSDAHRESQDGIFSVRVVDSHIAVEEGFLRNDVLLQYTKVEEAGLINTLGRHDTARWTLS